MFTAHLAVVSLLSASHLNRHQHVCYLLVHCATLGSPVSYLASHQIDAKSMRSLLFSFLFFIVRPWYNTWLLTIDAKSICCPFFSSL